MSVWIFTMHARALLWLQDEHRAYLATDITKNKTALDNIFRKMCRFPALLDTVKFVFKDHLVIPPQVMWQSDNVTVVAQLRWDKGLPLLQKYIDDLVNYFQDAATDGYLEGDAVIYEQDQQSYEYVIDNIKVEVELKNGTVVKRCSYPTYWIR